MAETEMREKSPFPSHPSSTAVPSRSVVTHVPVCLLSFGKIAVRDRNSKLLTFGSLLGLACVFSRLFYRPWMKMPGRIHLSRVLQSSR